MLQVVTLPPGGWVDTADGATRDAAGTAVPCEGIEPFSTTLVAAVTTPDGLLVSGTVEAGLG